MVLWRCKQNNLSLLYSNWSCNYITIWVLSTKVVLYNYITCLVKGLSEHKKTTEYKHSNVVNYILEPQE